MKRNNTKLLSPRQLDEMNEKFEFIYDEPTDSVLVKCRNYKKITPHPASQGFAINSKIRKVSFTTDSIQIWKELKANYSLLDVQQTVNKLYLTYQPITKSSVENSLKTNNFTIKSLGREL